MLETLIIIGLLFGYHVGKQNMTNGSRIQSKSLLNYFLGR